MGGLVLSAGKFRFNLFFIGLSDSDKTNSFLSQLKSGGFYLYRALGAFHLATAAGSNHGLVDKI